MEQPPQLMRIVILGAGGRLGGAFVREYRDKFGFPFIIAVRRHSKDAIFGELRRRLGNDSETELRAGLDEVFLITRLRLEDLVGAPTGSSP